MKHSIAVIYHAECLDGFTGAWAAWKKFGNKAEYFPQKHQSPPPSLKDKVIYFIDIATTPDFMKALVANNKHIAVLDHHRTAIEGARFAHEVILNEDGKHSGAWIAWNYFHSEKKIPRLVEYVEDEDLWKFTHPKTREIMAAIEEEPKSFERWNTLARIIENTLLRKKIIQKGAIILAYKNAIVERLATKAERGTFEGRDTWILNTQMFESEIGNVLRQKGPPLAILWREAGGRILVSLRSTEEIDVSELAKKYGGGGHPQAAGFKMPLGTEKPWTIKLGKS